MNQITLLCAAFLAVCFHQSIAYTDDVVPAAPCDQVVQETIQSAMGETYTVQTQNLMTKSDLSGATLEQRCIVYELGDGGMFNADGPREPACDSVVFRTANAALNNARYPQIKVIALDDPSGLSSVNENVYSLETEPILVNEGDSFIVQISARTRMVNGRCTIDAIRLMDDHG